MTSEMLEFADATVQVSALENVVYMRVSGLFSDDVALRMTHYLDGLIAKSPVSLIRVWDASGIPAGSFQLTTTCLGQLAQWARRVRTQHPGSLAYMVGSTPVSYGMARAYEAKAGLEETGIIVVHSLSELPPEVRQKLPA